MITLDERKTTRKTLKQLGDFKDRIELNISRNTDIAESDLKILSSLADTDQVESQLRALRNTYQMIDNQYDEELRYAAQFRLSPFCEYMFRDEAPVLHQEFLIDHMEKVHSGEIKRLAISMPPGASKTSYASIRFSAWHLGRRPNDRWLQGAHTMTFAKDRLGKPVRGLITENRYRDVFPDMVLSSSSSAADYFEFAGHRGYYKAVGVGTGIAGYRFEMGAIDDPIASREDAESPTFRRKLHNWFDDDFGTRPSNPDAPIFIVNCLVGDTKISLSNGTWKYIKDIELGDSVCTLRAGKAATDVVTLHTNQGPDEIWELKTGQNTIRANARHPFLVERPNGIREFVQLRHIIKGDNIVRQKPIESVATIDTEYAWALGFMVGDGWVTINKKRNYDKIRDKHYETASWVTCVAACPKYPDRHQKCMDTLSERFESNWRDFSGKYGYFRSEKAAMGRELHSFGLGDGAKDKRIPEWIYRESIEVRRAFIEGMRAADGAYVHNNTYRIGVSNRLLIEDFRHLCQISGVHCTNVYEQHFVTQPPNSKAPVQGYTASFNHDLTKEYTNLSTVVSNTNTNTYEDVFDIAVGDDANFVADGLYCKNTRWHEDDLVGHELQKMAEGRGDNWTVLNIPALAVDEDDILGREIGDGLWPEQFGKAFYESKKRTLTGTAWNSLYQGNPTDEEGGVLSRADCEPRYKHLPKDEKDPHGEIVKPVIKRVTLSLDCAEKATERSDFTAASVWVETYDKKHYLVHAARTKKEFSEMVQWIEELARATYCGHRVSQILVEDRGAGTQYIQVRKTSPGFAPVIPINTKQQSKTFRFDGVTVMFSTGRALLPESGNDWIADVESEIFAFPYGRNDDYVDTISQYLAYYRENNITRGSVRLRSTG